VEAMWRMLQQDRPDDYVIGTGEVRTVKDFVEAAFAHAGLDWREWVSIDPKYYRPTEVDHLRADTSKVKAKMNWEPKVTFKELVTIMVDHDVRLVRTGSGDQSDPMGHPIATLAA
jgi:GDPmannose 4,6-dehydratase